MTKLLYLYHANCIDGFTAAWAAWLKSGSTAEYKPVQYGQQPPLEEARGKDVIILDFSYKRAALVELARAANSVLILDHHETAEQELRTFEAPDDHGLHNHWHHIERLRASGELRAIAHFDMKRSGAMMAWDFFHNEAPPPLVEYVQDYDLWKFRLDKSREVNAYIRSFDADFNTWTNMRRTINLQFAGTVVPQGTALLRQHFKHVKEHVRANMSKRPIVLADHRVSICNAPPAWASDAGHYIVENLDQPFGATYYILPSGDVKFSLRSTDNHVAVSTIAALFGGGGHRNAAGFVLTQAQFQGMTAA